MEQAYAGTPGVEVLVRLTVTITGARMKSAGRFLPVQIVVTPLAGGNLGPLYLVVFRHDIEPLLAPSDKSADAALLRHLEEELQALHEAGLEPHLFDDGKNVIPHAALGRLLTLSVAQTH